MKLRDPARLKRLAEIAVNEKPAFVAASRPTSKKPSGRPERWAEACSKARAAHQELLNIVSDAQAKWDVEAQKLADAFSEIESLKDEYDEWLGNLPENLQSSGTYDKLQAISDLDVDCPVEVGTIDGEAVETTDDRLDEFENADLPQGFGRD